MKKYCIEGLRILACFGVFLCHFKGAFFYNLNSYLFTHTPLKIMVSGNTFVRIMFVISGFVLGYKYINKQNSQSIILSDIVKRYFRLMPLILVINLFVFLLMRLNLLYNIEVSVLTGSEEFLGLFNNFIPDLSQCLKEALWTTYILGGNAYNGPMWTMVYEYLGSLLVLIVMALTQKRMHRIIFYIVFLLGFSNYYCYFVLGMVICEIYNSTKIQHIIVKKHYSTFAMLLLSFSLVSMMGGGEIDKSKYNRILFAVLIIIMMISLLNNNFIERILSNKFVLKAGSYSYAFYLIHWPIIMSFSCWFYKKTLNYGRFVNIGANFAISLILICVFSMVLTEYIGSFSKVLSDHIAKHFVCNTKKSTRIEDKGNG